MKKRSLPLPIRLGSAVILLILILLAVVYSSIMPIRQVPEPTGPLGVGTLVYDLIDPDRPEGYDLKKGTLRKIRIQLWYPTEKDEYQGNRVPWMSDGRPQIRAIVKTHGFPSAIWDHTVFMKAHARYAALPSAGQSLPVVLISHGWQGYRNLHTDLAEELASRGYLVAAADHTYGAAAVVFDDGRIVPSEPRILPRREDSDRFLEHAASLVTTFAEDNRFILDHLSRVNQGRALQGPPALSLFADRLDLEHIGVAGHSTGGGAMVQLALEDPRVDAVLGFDAWVEPVGADKLAEGAAGDEKIPMLFFRSQTWQGGINDGFLVPFVASQGDSARLYQIDGTTHEQFTMLYMYAPAVKWLGMLGDTDPKAFARFLNGAAAAFFDHALKGTAMARLDYPGLKEQEE